MSPSQFDPISTLPARDATGDLTAYRESPSDRQRVADLMALLPDGQMTILDIGARDGYISLQLAERCTRVTALDLETPSIDHDRVDCVSGDVTDLAFPDASFDIVFCAEVLEHIPSHLLMRACHELCRVSKRYVLIGVPYMEDNRVGRTTCRSCGRTNPPWGHVNTFDKGTLKRMFPACTIAHTSFVGSKTAGTNPFSCTLMDWAGNPYGTYAQHEPCVHCGAQLMPPAERTVWQKIFTRLALYANDLQRPFLKPHPNWIHVLLDRRKSVALRLAHAAG